MKSKDKIIIVVYLDVTDVADCDIIDCLEKVKIEGESVFDDSVEVMVVPKRGCGHTTVVCINPVTISDDDRPYIDGMVDFVGGVADRIECELKVKKLKENDYRDVLENGFMACMTCDEFGCYYDWKPMTPSLKMVYKALYEHKYLIFNLARQTGFTSLMINYAYAMSCEGKNVLYVTDRFRSKEEVVQKANWFGLFPIRFGENKFSVDLYKGHVKFVSSNDVNIDFYRADVVIFDNADFYDCGKLSEFIDCITNPDTQIVIASTPNKHTSFMESTFKHIWCGDDKRFEQFKVTKNLGVNEMTELLDMLGAVDYDFEVCNGDLYFGEIKPSYELLTKKY